MANNYPSETDSLRTEIAIAAARMIAEDGVDYSTAKRKAAKQILGDAKTHGSILPDNAQIEKEVREYNALFLSNTQPARLHHLRNLALKMMELLQQFNPYLTGAILNGTAGEHSDVHLQLFADSPKDVEIYLLNNNINFKTSETSHFKKHNEPVEILSFMWQQEVIHLVLYQHDDLRGAVKKGRESSIERLNSAGVRALILESSK